MKIEPPKESCPGHLTTDNQSSYSTGMNQHTTNGAWMTTEDTTAALGISAATLYRREMEGVLRPLYRKVRGRLRKVYSRAKVEALAKNGKER